MGYWKNIREVQKTSGNGHDAYPLLTAENGCVAGCCTGVSHYILTEYGAPGIHDDQEGFYVVGGTGWAKVGDQEFPVQPGISFIAPAGVPHVIRKNPDSKPVEVFWFHAAV